MEIMTYANVIPATLAFLSIGFSYMLARREFPKMQAPPDFGRGQRYCKQAGAAETIMEYVEIPVGSHVNIMTDDFQKWILSEMWMSFVQDRLSAGADITVFAAGDAHKNVPEKIKALALDKKLEIVLCGDTPFEKHFTTVSNPRQIWYEEKHVGHFADNCIYTRFPYRTTWDQLESYFRSLRQEAVL